MIGLVKVAGFIRRPATSIEEISAASELCRELHPESQKMRVSLPIAPFQGMRCSECGLCVTDWHLTKTLFWIVLIGWWWKGEQP